MANLLFGKLFWIWIVAFIISAIYFVAQSASNFRQLWNPHTIIASKNKKKYTQQTKTKKRLDVILASQNIFDPKGLSVTTSVNKKQPLQTSKTPKKEEPKVVQSGGCPPMPVKLVLKELRGRIKLRGISYTEEDPSFSVAAIYVKIKLKKKKKKKKKKRRRRYSRHYKRVVWRIKMFRVGEMVMGSRLCSVNRKYVILYKYKKFSKLSLFSKKKQKDYIYGAIGLLRKLQSQGPGEVKVNDSDKFTISRKTVNNWLANPMQYAMSARIMPHYINGQPAGFRLVWVRKGSLYAQIGLKSGDIIQQINGKNLSVGTALGLYSKLPYAKQLKVNIIRKGSKRSMLYNIK